MGLFTLVADFNELDGSATATTHVLIRSAGEIDGRIVDVQVIGTEGTIFDFARTPLVDGVLSVQLPADDSDPSEFGYVITRSEGLTTRWQVPVQPPSSTVDLKNYTEITPLPLPNQIGDIQQELDDLEAIVEGKVDLDELVERVQDIIGSTLVAGTNVTMSYNDTAGTFTINAAGGSGGGLDAEQVQDLVAALIVAGDNITKDYNDPAATLTLAAESGDTLTPDPDHPGFFQIGA